eukprot:2027770-Pyramimonas_sp.AAC.1
MRNTNPRSSFWRGDGGLSLRGTREEDKGVLMFLPPVFLLFDDGEVDVDVFFLPRPLPQRTTSPLRCASSASDASRILAN